MHFLLTRPQEDNHKLAQALTRLGHRVNLAPLLRINYFDRQEIDLANFQAILFTSANGVRAFVRNSQSRDLPCYAVGHATATEAHEAGFNTVHAARGDVTRLASLVMEKLHPDGGKLLHISARDTAGNLSALLEKANFRVTGKQLYKATKARALDQKTKRLITSGMLSHMTFYSPRTAKAFVQLIGTANLANPLTEITALCLSPAVSDVISSLNWQETLTAEHPDQRHLFQLIGLTLEGNRQ